MSLEVEIDIECLDCNEAIGLGTPAFHWLIEFLQKHSGHRIKVLVVTPGRGE